MQTTTMRRTGGLAALALSLSVGLAACSEDEPSSSASSSDETSSEPTQEETEASGPAAQTFGPGCSAVPTSGDGSFDGMATEPVATAASANPLLQTLVTAVGEAGLVDTLNSAENITVFAPTDDAFAKIPEEDLNAVLANKQQLTSILTHHVVGEQLAPEDLSGTFETLNGDMLTIEGSGEDFTVDKQEQATILCGNIPTANATVYVVDTVLMP